LQAQPAQEAQRHVNYEYIGLFRQLSTIRREPTFLVTKFPVEHFLFTNCHTQGWEA